MISMSSSLQQGLSSNSNLNNLSPASHERFDGKKKSGKRKNSLKGYGSSKRRKLTASLSRKQVPVNECDTLLDSPFTERYSSSNAVLTSGLNCDQNAPDYISEHDGNPRSAGEDKQAKYEEIELCTNMGLDNRIMACSQAAQLDTAEVLCSSPALLSVKSPGPVSKSACNRMQGASEKRVLRPRRVCNKEIKENLPPLADSPLIVGRRIEVYWPLDAAWYCGLISAYDNIRKKHKVSYDDGEEEWLHLAREKFKFEVPLKLESAKASEVVKDDLSLSALPSSSPQRELHDNGTSNGSPMPVNVPIVKPTPTSVKITSPQAGATASNVLSSEATNLNARFLLRGHRGISVGSGKGRTGIVYERRQRPGLKGRSGGADHVKMEATKRVKSSEGQHLQEVRNSRKKHFVENLHHKAQASPLCSEGPQNIKMLDSAPEDGNDGAAGQEGRSKLRNSKKRKRPPSLSDEASIDRISKEGAQGVLESGVAVHCPSGELHRKTRKKHKIKSLAYTSLAAEGVKDVGSSVVQEHNQTTSVKMATPKMSKPSWLPLPNHTLMSRDKEIDTVCGDNSPSNSSYNAGKLEHGLNKRFERRKSKTGRRCADGYGRGRGHLRRRITNRNRISRGSTPSDKPQGQYPDSDKGNGLVNSSHDQFFHQADCLSVPLPSMEVASTDCKCIKGLDTGSISYVTAVMKRSAVEARLAGQHCSVFDWSLEPHGRLSPLRAFHSTIHYPRPVVLFGLFTWQLFNMLEAVGLSGGDCFEGKFWWMGSTRDLSNIVLLFMAVVKSLPLTNQKCQQCWQGRISHELWSVLSRKEHWSRNLPAILSPQADDLLMQHVRQLISGHGIVNMTSRQMLNIFSSYILKPFVVAILCEKGAQLRVVMQQYVLTSCHLQDGISFKRQFVRSMKLRSQAGGAEADFVSCLMLLPVATYQGMGAGKIIEDWIASVAYAGYVQLPIPFASFEFSRNQGLLFTTASVLGKKTTHIGLSTPFLEQIGGGFGAEGCHLGHLLLPREAGDLLYCGRLFCFYEWQKRLDFYTGLCFNSMLQKWLDSAGGKSIASGHALKRLDFKVDLVAKGGGTLDNCNCTEASVCNQISLERNSTVAVKEEDISPGRATQFDKDATSNMFMGSPTIYSLNDLAYSASGSSSCSSDECITKWRTTKMADISFRPHDTLERKGVYGEGRYRTSGQHFKKQAGSKRRPRGCEQENPDMQHLNLFCTANILLSNDTRSWREFGVRVELQPRKSEWVIYVQLENAIYSHKVIESTITSRVNRYTHAMMWKGGDGWVLEFCDRSQWIRFKGMHEECGHRNARAAFVKQIPIPFVKQIEQSMEGRPLDSLLFGVKWPGEVETALDCTKRVYDMDSEDENWLERLGEKISIDAFERIIDKLERITYLRQGEMVASDEVAELCETMASEIAVLSIHHYWSEKRTRKDNALIRYFESPLPKKYQKQMDNWNQRMEELECLFPNVTKEELHRQYPQPPLFAFCWPSRGLDTDNMSKRLQRQRSQKHLNSLKYMRTSSFDTSEELQRMSLLRSQRVHDSDWYQATQKGDYWQRKIARDGFSEHLVPCFQPGNTDCTSTYEAQATAAAARQTAQMYLLRFDSALQRAVAAVMDFENTYIAEIAESATVSYEHLLDLKKRINRVMNQFSSLSGKEDFLERDADGSGDADEYEEDDPSWTVNMQEDGFGNSSFSLKEEGTFLSLSERAHLEAWMRSTLRQRAS